METLFFPFAFVGAMIVLQCLSLEQKEEHEESTAMATTTNQDYEDYVDPRIVGGASAKKGEFPFMVLILLDNKHSCGGSLYTNRLVVTAAHCCFEKPSWNTPFGKRKIGELAVVVGTNDKEKFSKDHERRGVVLVFPHHKYDPSPRTETKYDIALLMMSHAVALTKVIQLGRFRGSNDILPSSGTPCTVIGWGIVVPVKIGDKSPHRTARYLQKAELDIAKCSKSGYSQNICSSKEGKDPCMGDSGGPLLVNGTQVGLVSFGYGCAQGETGFYYIVDDDWLAEAAERCYEGVGYHVTSGISPLLTLVSLRAHSFILHFCN